MSTAVVAIFAHKEVPDPSERISLRQCARILSAHPLRLICPRGMNPREYLKLAPSLQVDEIDPHWLASLAAYNRLKVSRYLYEKYAEFDFMLTYELDSYVFRDELMMWCEKGYDYIGAPWFEGKSDADESACVIAGGNSGLSLRKIRSCLQVLQSRRLVKSFPKLCKDWAANARMSPGGLLLLPHLIKNGSFRSLPASLQVAEDVLWSDTVPRRFPWWRMANYQDASAFSFECLPRRLFAENNQQLPFGCHKWMQYDPDFWKKYVH